MRTVSYRLVDLQNATIRIGFVGENQHTQVIFDSKKVFDEYPNAVPSLAVCPPVGETYPAVTIRDGDLVTWDVEDSDLVHEGNGELQLSFIENGVVCKTFIARTVIARSLLPTGEVPTPIENWIDEANEAVGTIRGAVQAAQDAQTAAETAQGKAETAQGKAEDAQAAAELAESHASASADAASRSETNAGNSETAAASSAADAYRDAERAEQAANNAGSMEVEIDADGHLIYRKTEMIETDFNLNGNGHLIMEVA